MVTRRTRIDGNPGLVWGVLIHGQNQAGELEGPIGDYAEWVFDPSSYQPLAEGDRLVISK